MVQQNVVCENKDERNKDYDQNEHDKAKPWMIEESMGKKAEFSG